MSPSARRAAGEGNFSSAQSHEIPYDGELILARFNPEGYHEQSRTKIIDPTWSHPAYAAGSVFARSDTEIVCVPLTVAEEGE